MIATMPSAVFNVSLAEGRPTKEIIGVSRGLRLAWDAVRLVAPVESAVLISGETGTGKELVARAVHDLSSRSRAPFVRVNCAAIPAGLLESEFFGHERGAYTGAVTQTIGRFELANQGTLFLDEIGDLPLELQPKLLRVLQDQEFERVGGTRTIRVNIRIVAATNLDLAEMVRARRFRADLFYRLNVFPITVPPLRERSEDIPELVGYFVRRFSQQMAKEIDIISNEVMEILRTHDWPGNIRELENFIERAVVVSAGPVLRPPIGDLRVLARNNAPSAVRTLAQAEREHILDVLRQTAGRVGGDHGAAARLGLPRTTLASRMRKLGINKPSGNGKRRISLENSSLQLGDNEE
jgi:formate hydrogenlyase transcriptional activator